MKKLVFFLFVLTLLGCKNDNPFDGMYREFYEGKLVDSYIVFCHDETISKTLYVKEMYKSSTQYISVGTVEYDNNKLPYLTERYVQNRNFPADWMTKRIDVRTKEDSMYLYGLGKSTFVKQDTEKDSELQEKQHALQALALLVAKYDFDM